jgi:Holliday junction resolvasome RuvABC endonuclease subunit
MRLLALDLGTSCGYAIREDGLPIFHGTLDLRPRRYEGGGMRFVTFRGKLQSLLHGTTQVAFEEVRRHLGVDAAHVYGGLMAILTAECEIRDIPYQGIPVGTIKKHATGKGNADKSMMLDAARAKWPTLTVANDDEADALWLADYALTGAAQ